MDRPRSPQKIRESDSCVRWTPNPDTSAALHIVSLHGSPCDPENSVFVARAVAFVGRVEGSTKDVLRVLRETLADPVGELGIRRVGHDGADSTIRACQRWTRPGRTLIGIGGTSSMR